MFEIHLSTFKKKCYTNCSDIDKRLWLFGAESFKEMDDNVKDDSNRFIIDEYDREKVNKKIWRSFEMQSFKQGVERGIQKGKKENSIEIAKKMLDKKIDSDLIIECTGLTIDDLDNLRGAVTKLSDFS